MKALQTKKDGDRELIATIVSNDRLLTAAEFHRRADVPPEVEWFANLTNAHTRRAYEKAVGDFMRLTGINLPEEFRTVTRAHIIAWRDDLRTRLTRAGTSWSDTSIRHRLSALAALFEYLCERNAVTHNPVKGVERARSESGKGKTPAIGDHQARKLLVAPFDDSVRGKRDRAILSTLLFRALRREELCKLKVRDFRHARKGVPHLLVAGKGGKTRCVPLRPGTHELIHDYLYLAGHGEDDALTQLSFASRSVRTRCGRRQPPTRSSTRRTSQRCRNGWDMPTLPRHECTIIAVRRLRIARCSKSPIDAEIRRDF